MERKRETESERASERDRSALLHISVESMYSLLVNMNKEKEEKEKKFKHLKLNVSKHTLAYVKVHRLGAT